MATISKAAAFLICLTVSAMSIGLQAQSTSLARDWALRGGFSTVLGGQLIRLTVFEAGAETARSTVVIEFRDAANRVVASRKAELTFASHVQLNMKVPDGVGPTMLRAVVAGTNVDDLSAPIVTFEAINPDLGITMKLDPPCGPFSGPDSGQANCTGWHVTSAQ